MTGDDLKKWRERRGLNQTEMAQFLGVDQGTISRWEGGKREIPSFLHLALESIKKKSRAGKRKRERR